MVGPLSHRWGIVIGSLLLGLTAGAVFVSRTQYRTEVPVLSPTVSATPSPRPTPARDVTLLFVGDIMLSRSVGQYMAAINDWTWPFGRIASTTAAADLAFANLETTISTRGTANGCGFCFRSDPRAVAGLTKAGFDVVSVANNHIWDYGAQAFSDTLSALASAGISYVGGGLDIAQARAGVIKNIRGTRIAYLGYTNILPASAQAGPNRPGANIFDLDRMKEDITVARAKADVVLVSFHTGTEYETTHNAFQDQVYHAAIDAGADMVIGHHPHVVQEVERYGSGWIAYSLGNFVFDQAFSAQTLRGLMLSVVVRDHHIASVQQLSIDISRQFQPSLAPAGH